MIKNNKQPIGDLINDIKEDILFDIGQKEIPDIITFCNDKKWLGLPTNTHNPLRLYPVQKLILKTFYRGSIGNKNTVLSDEEIRRCQELGLTDDNKGNLIEKYYSGELFRELVLVWGRRASKDFIVSIIALYEAMKLLECEGGDPYAVYELSAAAPINILTVANSGPQASRAFDEIKGKFLYSDYFKDKFTRDGIGKSSIYLLTPQDKKDNKVFKEKGLPTKKGSIGIIVGHSNSDTLLGMGCIVLILDEVASYKTTGGASSGDRIYTALTPTVATYCKKTYEKDKNDNFVLDEYDQRKIIKREYDGKIISISSPRSKEGKFFELFDTAKNAPNRLACRLATWDVNPTHTRESLRETFPNMSELEFNMEFGGEFAGIGSENFFTEDQINLCFKGHNLQNQKRGVPGRVYFAHIDPATSSHNYALVVLHREHFLNRETRKTEFVIVVDHIQCWHPTIDSPVSIAEVDNYIVGLKRKFHLGMLTYDQFNCVSPEEYIYTTRGLIKAKNLDQNDIVYSKDGNLNNVIKLGFKKEVTGYEIETKFGYKLKMNDVHPIYIKDNGFVESKNINIGDNILLKDFKYNFGKINKPYEALLMGYLVSEGNINVNKKIAKNGNIYKSMDFTNTDKEVVEDYIYIGKKVLSKKPSVYQTKYKNPKWKTCYSVRYMSLKDCNIIEKLGFKGKSHYRRIPNFVMQGNKNTVSNFLSSLYEGDGTVNVSISNLIIDYNTVSKELAEQIQLLLLGFSIKSSLNYYRNQFFNGKRCPFYRISIYGDNIITFAKEIGFRSSIKKEKIKKCVELQKSNKIGKYRRKPKGLRKSVNKKSRSKYMYDKVVSIKKIKLDIINIEVDGDHTYIANGIVSHNSQESIIKLRKASIPNKLTRFNYAYKNAIYRELENLVNAGRLKIPYHPILRKEMEELQRKFDAKGFKIFPKKEGDGIKSDDIVDSLAGACYIAVQMRSNKLPHGLAVNAEMSSGAGQIVWRSMQGTPYGVGSGQQVASALEKRASWPGYKR